MYQLAPSQKSLSDLSARLCYASRVQITIHLNCKFLIHLLHQMALVVWEAPGLAFVLGNEQISSRLGKEKKEEKRKMEEERPGKWDRGGKGRKGA